MPASDLTTSIPIIEIAGVEVRPGWQLIVDGLDWSWAFAIFKQSPGNPGYGVDSLGQLWTRRKNKGLGYGRGTISVLSSEWRWKKAGLRPDGYRGAGLWGEIPGKARKWVMSRLILTTFYGPCPLGYQACHKNGDRLDDRLENLRWGTPASNCEDKIRHGTIPRGVRHGCAKLNETQVQEIKRLHRAGRSKCSLGRQFYVADSTINRIVVGKGWKNLTSDERPS